MLPRASRQAASPPARCCRLLAMACLGLPVVCLGADPPASDADQTTVIEGQVFNHFGAGVQGVQVYVTRPPQGTDTPPKLATTTTNQTGDFRLVMPEAVAGKLVVTMTAPGYAVATRELEIDPQDEFPPFVDVELSGSAVLAGMVRDAPSDKPIAGATVQVSAAFKQLSARSDQQGAFQIAGLLPGQVTVIIDADGYGRERSAVSISQNADGTTELQPDAALAADETAAVSLDAGGRLIVELKPERIVHLRIVDDRGGSVGGALIEMLDEDRQDFRTLAADADGKVTIRGIHYDTSWLDLRLAHERYVSSEDFDRSIDLPPENVESTHTLTMLPAGIIAGRITDRAGGDPLNGARIMVGTRGHQRTPRDWSDFEGSYRITGVAPGKQAVTVHLADHAPQLVVVAVTAGGTVTLDVKLEAANQVGGRVVDADGSPVGGAHVSAIKWRNYETLGLQAMTGADGRFIIDNAPADEFLIALTHPQYQPLEALPVQAPRTDYRFELGPTVTPGGRANAKVKLGEQAPDFELVTLDGKSVKLADLKGKTVLLDFWATWCGPCIIEIPNLKKVHRAFAKRGDFMLIGISLDQSDRPVKKFVTDKKITWPQAVGKKSGAEKAINAYGVTAVPTTFLIGPDGRVRAIDLYGPKMDAEIAKTMTAAPNTEPRP